MRLATSIWFLSYSCPYLCPYCWSRDKVMPHDRPKIPSTPDEKWDWICTWSEAWNRLNPGILDLTGGEPFFFPIPELVRELNPTTQIAFTSNGFFREKLLDLARTYGNDRVVSCSLSYHPSQKVGDFWGMASEMVQRGLHVNVNFVGYPDQVEQVESVERSAKEAGVHFHFDPYAVPEGRPPAVYTERQLELIRRYTGTDRAPQVDPRPQVSCPAGIIRAVVLPDGTTYPCLQHYGRDTKCLGNILQPDFKLGTESLVCDFYRFCAGCDRDKVQKEWTDVKVS